MRGHLEQRGKNTWRAKVFLGVDAQGRRKYLNKTLHGPKRVVEGELNAMVLEASRGVRNAEDPTFRDLVDRWREVGSLSLSPSTLAEYERILKRRLLPRFGATKLRSLRAAEIDAFYAELVRGGPGGKPMGARSVHHIHAVFRMLFNHAVRWEQVHVNPVSRANPPRVIKTESVIPSPADVHLLLARCVEVDPELACFFRLSAISGARRGELCALRWSDIDLEVGLMRIERSLTGTRGEHLTEKGTKTHAKRRVSLDIESRNDLEAHLLRCQLRADACCVILPESAFVFSRTPDGLSPWRPDRVTLAFRRAADRLGLYGVRLHDLRHFSATQLLAAGVPIKSVSARLGHANATTTLNVYAHQIETVDERAAEVLAGLLTGAGESAL